jgi:hypothetical protein
MKNIKAFLYFFILFGLFIMTKIYLTENFHKPFSSLNTQDIIRIIMAVLVEIVCIFLVYDTFSRFNEISKAKKNGFNISCNFMFKYLLYISNWGLSQINIIFFYNRQMLKFKKDRCHDLFLNSTNVAG